MQRVIHASIKIVSILTVLFTAHSCLKSDESGLPPAVVEVISQTGHNRVELTKTIGQFIDSNDSLFLKSSYFLIANIAHQYAADYVVKNSQDQIIPFDPKAFDSFESMDKWWKAQKKSGIGYDIKKFTLDKDTITADLLIATIKQAISSRSYPWSESYSDEDFYRYILPYRFGNEPIHDWRTPILQDFSWIFDSLQNNQEPEKIMQLVNDYVDEIYLFDKRYLRSPQVQTYAEIKNSRRGNQLDIAHLKAAVMRTFGIPATIDYVPYLADSIYGFHFAVAQNKRGSFVPLLPQSEKTIFKSKKIPKVYRRIYHSLDSSLFALKNLSLKTPPYLGHYHYLDVSEQYLDADDLSLKPKSKDTLFYIGVFNDNKWRAVDWAISKNSLVTFHALGQGINYQLLEMKNDTLVSTFVE
ncbi:MAG: transglutaminase family protein [Bacteroidetes bacterium]|nr:transglutaminase family protein [Bacteroidota bacterium]MBU1580190.1 transglutaminase family protein [Bacteroidota bacterium]MBU2557837.1 transglutaminase family protein [Bacteroidota bacterium]